MNYLYIIIVAVIVRNGSVADYRRSRKRIAVAVKIAELLVFSHKLEVIGILRNVEKIAYCKRFVFFRVVAVDGIGICRDGNVLAERIEYSERVGNIPERLYAFVCLYLCKKFGKVGIVAYGVYIEAVFVGKLFIDRKISVLSKKIV